MANEQMIQSVELKHKIDLLDEQAIELYETREALDTLLAALEDIIDAPNKAASDAVQSKRWYVLQLRLLRLWRIGNNDQTKQTRRADQSLG